jgi:hypothetical protein
MMTDKIFLNNQPERILLSHDKEIEFSSYIRKDLILTRCDSQSRVDIEKKKNGLDLSCDPGPGSDLVAKHDVSIFDFVYLKYFPKNISEPIRLK